MAARGELAAATSSALQEARQNDPNLNASMSAMQVALAQRDNLAQKIAGPGVGRQPNSAAARHHRRRHRRQPRRRAPEDRRQVAARRQPRRGHRNADQHAPEPADRGRHAQPAGRRRFRPSRTRPIKDTQAQIEQMTKTMEQVRAEQQEAIANVTHRHGAEGHADPDDLRRRMSASWRRLREQIQSLQAANAEMGGRNRTLETELDTRPPAGSARSASTPRRPSRAVPTGTSSACRATAWRTSTSAPATRSRRGSRSRSSTRATASPSPATPRNDENLPAGQGVDRGRARQPQHQRVPRHALARRARRSARATCIVNLVYDKNTKYNFLVYGNFDLDRNGVATPQDAEVIKRLVTQWGGNIVSDINVDTDFVVLGREPEIPTASRDELDDDPILKARYDAAVAESEAYAEISAKAREYRIPILNQNRFLYLIGYYNQAKR